MATRDMKLDYLRFLGLAFVILAHVEPPFWLSQFRNFDVPLMVLVAGASFGLSYKDGPYLVYLWKRIKRLVFPVWIFLSLYLGSLYLWQTEGGAVEVPNQDTIWASYELIDGIGYVWIIRVLLLVALVAPWIASLSRRISSSWLFLFLLASLYGGYDWAERTLEAARQAPWHYYLEMSLFYLLPYGAVFALGMRFLVLSRRAVVMVTLLAFAAFAYYAYRYFSPEYGFIPTQTEKFPATAYYLSYAVAMAGICWLFMGRLARLWAGTYVETFATFVSRHSIWIYLWHIPFIKGLDMEWGPKYFVTFACAVIIAYVQNLVVERVLLPHVRSSRIQRDIHLVLQG